MTTRNLVGIGTTDPQYTLDVAGDLNITGGLFTNGQNASGSLYWSETAAENIVASTNVGIGITGEPVAPLHVGGDARIDGNLTVNGTQTVINTNVEETSRIEVINNGTGPAMVVNQTGAQPVADFQDDGVSAFFIADGGNVGIGITNPSGKFNVAISGPTSFTNQSEGTIAFGNATSGVGAIMPTIQAKSNGGTDRIGLNLQSGTTDANSNPDMRFNVRTSTDTDFATLTSRAFDFTRFTTPLMTILRNGNVGIGVTNPGNRLQVVGSATGNMARFMSNQATLSEISGVVIVANGGSADRRAGLVLDPNGGIGSGVNYGVLDYYQGGEFRMNNTLSTGFTTLFTNNTERMRIAANGNVGIGTTNPSQKLTIADSIGPFLRFDRIGTGSFDFEIGMPGNADLIFRGGANGTGSQLIEYMRIAGNGNVGIGITNPVGKFNVFTGLSGTSFNMNAQEKGTIGFSNGSGSNPLPVISGKSDLSTGLLIIGGNDDTSSSPSLVFDARASDGSDFTELGTPAFRFTRANINLLTLLRNGNVGIGFTNPPSSFSVATPSTATNVSTRSVFGLSSGNQIDVTSVDSGAVIILDNHIRATLTATSARAYAQASTVRIDGPPIAGTNVTFTNTASLTVELGDIKHNNAVWAAPAGTAPLYSARAWATYNGNANALLDSGNIASYEKLATGSYRFNFTTAMPSTNYSVTASIIPESTTGAWGLGRIRSITTTSFILEALNASGTLHDVSRLSFAVFI